MKVKLSDLYCKILVQNKNAQVVDVAGKTCYCCTNSNQRKHVLCRLIDTPHFKFLNGNREIYQQYLEMGGRLVGYGLEHSVSNFDKLINTFDLKRVKTFPCHLVDGLYVLQDGIHRCCIILFNSLLQEIPVSVKKR